MPHIQFDHSLDISDEQIDDLTTFVMNCYSEEMDTTTGHIAITFRRFERNSLVLGRASPDSPLVLIQADVRRGRSFKRKRRFALALFEYLQNMASVPSDNMKIVFTEHAGEEMMGFDRVGGEWTEE